jgi:hypothetical protein
VARSDPSPLGVTPSLAVLARFSYRSLARFASHPKDRSLATRSALGPGSFLLSEPSEGAERALRRNGFRRTRLVPFRTPKFFRRRAPLTLTRSWWARTNLARPGLGPSPVRPRFAWTNLTRPLASRVPSKLVPLWSFHSRARPARSARSFGPLAVHTPPLARITGSFVLRSDRRVVAKLWRAKLAATLLDRLSKLLSPSPTHAPPLILVGGPVI